MVLYGQGLLIVGKPTLAQVDHQLPQRREHLCGHVVARGARNQLVKLEVRTAQTFKPGGDAPLYLKCVLERPNVLGLRTLCGQCRHARLEQQSEFEQVLGQVRATHQQTAKRLGEIRRLRIEHQRALALAGLQVAQHLELVDCLAQARPPNAELRGQFALVGQEGAGL